MVILRAFFCLTVCMLSACASPAPPPATAARRLYWDVQLVAASVAVPGYGDAASLTPHFLADGSVVYQDQATGSVRLYADGKTSVVPLPGPAVDGGLALHAPQITWYADAKNFGGSSTAANSSTLGGGWAWVDGVLHECSGAACTPVLRQTDGTFVTRDMRGRFWMTWKPGGNPTAPYPMLDELDIQNVKLDLVLPCFTPQQTGADGSILVRFDIQGLLDCKNKEANLPRLRLIRNFAAVDISKSQFNLGFAVELDTCCDIWGINNVGQILGLVKGIPTIRSASKVESIGKEMGQVYAFNDVGDVLYATGVPPSDAYFRLHGTTWDVQACEVLKQLEGEHTENPLLTHAVAMRNDGAVLFWDMSAAAFGTGALYLATPRTQAIPAGVVGHLKFAKLSGAGPVPADLNAWRVQGDLADASLVLTLAGQTANACVDQTFLLTATRSAGAWHEGDLIPATTGVIPGAGTVIGILSYTDADGSMIAQSGGLRVTAVTPSSFTATPEGLVLKRLQTGATFAVTGSVVVRR